MRAMFLEFQKRGSPMTLLYSVRAPSEAAFLPALQAAAAGSGGRIRVALTVTGSRDAGWAGRRGRIDRGLIREEVCVCGAAQAACSVLECPSLHTSSFAKHEVCVHALLWFEDSRACAAHGMLRAVLRPRHMVALVAAAEQVPNLAACTAYMCGPDAFMQAVEGELHALGFPLARLHRESFAF